MRYVESTSLSHKRLEYANSLFICQFDVVVSQAKSNKCVKMTKTHVRGVPRADMGFCFVLFFSLNMQSAVVLTASPSPLYKVAILIKNHIQ